jgi:hypothetical protein
MISNCNGKVARMSFFTNIEGTCLLTTAQQALLNQLSFQLGIHTSPDFRSHVEVLLQEQSHGFRCDDFISPNNPFGTKLLLLKLQEISEVFPQVSRMLWRTVAHVVTWPNHQSPMEMVNRGPYTYAMMRSLIFSLIHTTDLHERVHCAFMREGCFAVISPETLVCTRISMSASFTDTPRSIRPQETERISLEWLKNLIIGLSVNMSLGHGDPNAVSAVMPNGTH